MLINRISIDIFRPILPSKQQISSIWHFETILVGRSAGNTLRLKPASYAELDNIKNFQNSDFKPLQLLQLLSPI